MFFLHFFDAFNTDVFLSGALLEVNTAEHFIQLLFGYLLLLFLLLSFAFLLKSVQLLFLLESVVFVLLPLHHHVLLNLILKMRFHLLRNLVLQKSLQWVSSASSRSSYVQPSLRTRCVALNTVVD